MQICFTERMLRAKRLLRLRELATQSVNEWESLLAKRLFIRRLLPALSERGSTLEDGHVRRARRFIGDHLSARNLILQFYGLLG